MPFGRAKLELFFIGQAIDTKVLECELQKLLSSSSRLQAGNVGWDDSSVRVFVEEI